jgi:hypothetical protein
MTTRDFKSSARDGETSGRPTQGGKPLSTSTIAIDETARDQALKAASDLSADLGALESQLAYLQGFFGEDHKLASAVLGSVGISATEMRQQLPALKQAIRDLPLIDGESS